MKEKTVFGSEEVQRSLADCGLEVKLCVREEKEIRLLKAQK